MIIAKNTKKVFDSTDTRTSILISKLVTHAMQVIISWKNVSSLGEFGAAVQALLPRKKTKHLRKATAKGRKGRKKSKTMHYC